LLERNPSWENASLKVESQVWVLGDKAGRFPCFQLHISDFNTAFVVVLRTTISRSDSETSDNFNSNSQANYKFANHFLKIKIQGNKKVRTFKPWRLKRLRTKKKLGNNGLFPKCRGLTSLWQFISSEIAFLCQFKQNTTIT